jgi:hypothetical protein
MNGPLVLICKEPLGRVRVRERVGGRGNEEGRKRE